MCNMKKKIFALLLIAVIAIVSLTCWRWGDSDVFKDDEEAGKTLAKIEPSLLEPQIEPTIENFSRLTPGPATGPGYQTDVQPQALCRYAHLSDARSR